MKTNYHAHTKWCRHGSGEIEEMILKAIEKGYDEFAITEHIPYPNYFGSRMYYDELDSFMNELNQVIEKYENKIKVYKALECEYFEEYHDYYIELKDKYNLDFLILGQHYPDLKDEKDFFFVEKDEDIKEYESYLIRGMESGLFDFIAHPDIYLARYYFTEQGKITANNIFKRAQELNLPIEINANGARKEHLGYPSKEFWKEALNHNNIVIVNSDSHHVDKIDDIGEKRAYELAKELGIKVTEQLNFNK